MRAVRAIVMMTVKQVLGVRRMIGLGLLALAPAGIFFLSSSRRGTDLMEPFTGIMIGLLFSVAVPVVTLIMATSVLGEERREATLSFIALRPIPRISIASAKFIGGIASAFVLTGLGGVAMALVMGLRSHSYAYVVPLFVGTFIATVAYAALFVPLGYLTERAMIIGLAFVFIWESAIAGAITGLSGTSPWRIGFTAVVGLAPKEFARQDLLYALGTMKPGAGGAVLRACILLVVTVWLTTWILRSRDLA
jgi:ABC-2 type transport system permease protein